MLNSAVSQQSAANSTLVCGCNTNAVGTSGVAVFASFNPVLGYCCSSQLGCRAAGSAELVDLSVCIRVLIWFCAVSLLAYLAARGLNLAGRQGLRLL